MEQPTWKNGKKFCACGKRISRWSSQCHPCFAKDSLLHAIEYLRIEKQGDCPKCGNRLVPNNSLAGSLWIQCLGSVLGKMCSFQILADKDSVQLARAADKELVGR